MSEAKPLSECGTKYVIEDGADGQYSVDIEPGDFLVVEAGSLVGKPASKFAHPNIAATAKRLYEFKWDRANGSKFWTSQAGVSHYLVIPRSAVKLLPEKGYSYVHAEINGVKVMFNVSGGGGPGWTDHLHTRTQISVNHPLKALKALAAVAVRGTPLEPVEVKQMEPQQEEAWNRAAARRGGGKEEIAKLAEAGKKPVVMLLPGYSYCGNTQGPATKVCRKYKKIPTGPDSWQWTESGALKGLVLDIGFGGVRAKVSQIDWAATLAANGVPA